MCCEERLDPATLLRGPHAQPVRHRIDDRVVVYGVEEGRVTPGAGLGGAAPGELAVVELVPGFDDVVIDAEGFPDDPAAQTRGAAGKVRERGPVGMDGAEAVLQREIVGLWTLPRTAPGRTIDL